MPGVEVTDETGKLPRYARLCYISAKFTPRLIGSTVKGSRQLAAEGLTAINYQLLALRCGQQPLVGNGFIRSAVMVSSAATGRATAINVSVQCKNATKKAPLKMCLPYGKD